MRVGGKNVSSIPVFVLIWKGKTVGHVQGASERGLRAEVASCFNTKRR